MYYFSRACIPIKQVFSSYIIITRPIKKYPLHVTFRSNITTPLSIIQNTNKHIYPTIILKRFGNDQEPCCKFILLVFLTGKKLQCSRQNIGLFKYIML